MLSFQQSSVFYGCLSSELWFLSRFKLFCTCMRNGLSFSLLIPLLQYNRTFSLFLGGREACLAKED